MSIKNERKFGRREQQRDYQACRLSFNGLPHLKIAAAGDGTHSGTEENKNQGTTGFSCSGGLRYSKDNRRVADYNDCPPRRPNRDNGS